MKRLDPYNAAVARTDYRLIVEDEFAAIDCAAKLFDA
jgi:hypothetical protein